MVAVLPTIRHPVASMAPLCLTPLLRLAPFPASSHLTPGSLSWWSARKHTGVTVTRWQAVTLHGSDVDPYGVGGDTGRLDYLSRWCALHVYV